MDVLKIFGNWKLNCTFVLAFFISRILIDIDLFPVIVLFMVLALTPFFIVSKNKFFFIFYFMCFVVFFYPIQYFDHLTLFKFINPLTFGGVVLFVLYLINKRVQKEKKLNFVDRAYLLFIIAGIIGMINAESKMGVLNWLFYSYFTGFLVYKIIMQMDIKSVEKIIDCFIFCGFITFLYGVIEYICQYSFILQKPMERFTSLLGTPLTNGFVIGIIFFLSLYKYSCSKNKIYLILSWLFLFAIIFTGARGAWYSLIVCLIFIFRRFGVNLKTIFSLLLILCLLSVGPASRIIKSRLEKVESGIHGSWNIRIESITIGLQSIKRNPLIGAGLFNSSRIKKDFTYDKVFANTSFENSWLGLFVDVGVIGGVAYILIPIVIILYLFRTRSKGDFFLAIAVLFMLLDATTFSILNVFRFSHFFYWAILAIAYRIVSNNKKMQDDLKHSLNESKC